MTKGRGIFKVEAPKKPEREYEIELRKLQAFTPQELDNLLTEVERKSKEGRGLFSRGNLLNYVSVPGFKVPIVKLYLGLEEMGSLVPEHNVKRILWHLKNERKLLPISAEFRVL